MKDLPSRKAQITELIAYMSEKIDKLQQLFDDIIEIANFASIPKKVSDILISQVQFGKILFQGYESFRYTY
jgi:hypothetical protein